MIENFVAQCGAGLPGAVALLAGVPALITAWR